MSENVSSIYFPKTYSMNCYYVVYLLIIKTLLGDERISV